MREWSCYGGGQFNGGIIDHVRGGGLFYGGRVVVTEEVTSLIGRRMVMLQRLSL